jgi:hypothetical protein
MEMDLVDDRAVQIRAVLRVADIGDRLKIASPRPCG